MVRSALIAFQLLYVNSGFDGIELPNYRKALYKKATVCARQQCGNRFYFFWASEG